MFRRATCAEPHGRVIPCGRCRRHVDVEAFAWRAGPSGGPLTFCPERDYPSLPEGQLREMRPAPHSMVDRLSGARHLVYLPAYGRVVARRGVALAPGQVWAFAMAECPRPEWRSKDRLGRWTSLPELAGGTAGLGLAAGPVAARTLAHEDLGDYRFLLPADLVCFASRAVRPIRLFWYFGRCGEYWDTGLGAAVFHRCGCTTGTTSGSTCQAT